MLHCNACAGALLALAASLPAAAQPADITPPPGPASTIVITGNPLRRADAQPAARVLSGDELAARRAGTLGDTLEGLPGVAGTGFGPNASRPVIRGLDGDRVRLLDNGGAALDASNLSFDHAVALDPLVAERVEVLRGPAALLYGGNATGGVVNVIDGRIPRVVVPFGGRMELRAGGAAAQRGGAAVIEGGEGRADDGWGWHVDAFGRRTSDLRVPRYTPLEDGVALAPTTRVRNSAGDASGAAVGGAWITPRGRMGVSLDGLRNDYGVTVEPDVTIRMRRERAALAGEWRLGGGWFDALELTAGHTRYRHQEVEGDGAVGTTFASRGTDLRMELRQAARGAWRGVVGVQAESMRFSALGEEAFVPGTRTGSAALFTLQSLELGALSLSAGLRGERVQVDSDGDAADAAEPRFGAAASRRFSPVSASLGATWRLDEAWTLNASLGHTERAPAYYELYADGVHVATAAYERGDATLGVERSRHAEAGLRWGRAGHELKLQAWATHFARYIALDASGRTIGVVDADGAVTQLPEYVFHGVRARMHGLELEGRTQVLDAGWKVDLTGSADIVRGTNLDTGEPLARLSPVRATLGVAASRGAFDAGVELRHFAAQRRVPATDIATPSATQLNLRASWRQSLGPYDLLWMLRLDNVTDTLATSATALQTVRHLSPLAGRALSAAVQWRF